MAKLTSERAREIAAMRKEFHGGRKRAEDEENIRAALSAVLPIDTVLQAFAKAVKHRESWAVTLWLAYLWGRPVERQEVTGAEGDAITVRIIRDEGNQARPEALPDAV